MRHIFLFIGVFLLSISCRQEENQTYTSREARQTLFPANPQYEYRGEVIFKELISGEIEVVIELDGDKGTRAYYFPAHLHFGAYDTPDVPMAAMLDPVDMKTLKSTTVLRELSDGNKLLFDDLEKFDGHVKIHLAADGPDYNIILSAGNIGVNSNSKEINMDNITVCAPY